MAADKTKSEARAKRLEEQLRANLARRKAKARAMRDDEGEDGSSGTDASAEHPADDNHSR